MVSLARCTQDLDLNIGRPAKPSNSVLSMPSRFESGLSQKHLPSILRACLYIPNQLYRVQNIASGYVCHRQAVPSCSGAFAHGSLDSCR